VKSNVPAWLLESRSVLQVERKHPRLSWQMADCPVVLVQPQSHAATASNSSNTASISIIMMRFLTLRSFS